MRYATVRTMAKMKYDLISFSMDIEFCISLISQIKKENFELRNNCVLNECFLYKIYIDFENRTIKSYYIALMNGKNEEVRA